MRKAYWRRIRKGRLGRATDGAPREVAGMRPRFHYPAMFPPAQARREVRVPATPAQADGQEHYPRNSWSASRPKRISRRVRGRMLEQFTRLKLNLNCGRHV